MVKVKNIVKKNKSSIAKPIENVTEKNKKITSQTVKTLDKKTIKSKIVKNLDKKNIKSIIVENLDKENVESNVVQTLDKKTIKTKIVKNLDKKTIKSKIVKNLDKENVESSIVKNLNKKNIKSKIVENLDNNDNKSNIVKKLGKSKIVKKLGKSKIVKKLGKGKIVKNLDKKNIKKQKKKKVLTPEIKEHLISEETVKKLVEAVVKAEEKNDKVLLDDTIKYLLQVTSVKMATGSTLTKNCKMLLKHSLNTEGTDVCLFVKDLQRGRKIDYEPTKQYYQQLLEKYHVKGITRIMPITELVTEHSVFEAKVKLVNAFDQFLVDGTISNYVGHILGSSGQKLKKNPIPIMELKDEPSIKENIENGMRHVIYRYSPTGNNISIEIGSNKMTVDQISENILFVIENLKKKLPGGWENIKTIHLKTNEKKTPVIQVYVNLSNLNKVTAPKITTGIEPKILKAKKLLEGDTNNKLIITNNAIVRNINDEVIFGIPPKGFFQNKFNLSSPKKTKVYGKSDKKNVRKNKKVDFKKNRKETKIPKVNGKNKIQKKNFKSNNVVANIKKNSVKKVSKM